MSILDMHQNDIRLHYQSMQAMLYKHSMKKNLEKNRWLKAEEPMRNRSTFEWVESVWDLIEPALSNIYERGEKMWQNAVDRIEIGWTTLAHKFFLYFSCKVTLVKEIQQVSCQISLTVEALNKVRSSIFSYTLSKKLKIN